MDEPEPARFSRVWFRDVFLIWSGLAVVLRLTGWEKAETGGGILSIAALVFGIPFAVLTLSALTRAGWRRIHERWRWSDLLALAIVLAFPVWLVATLAS